jgi:hypothetical protein
MPLRTIILGLILAVSFQIQAQQMSFVGLTKEDVKEKMKDDFKKFSPDETVVKQTYNYLKYVNRNNSITWIFYFSEKDICKSTKKVCDYSEYDIVHEELNEQCEKVADGEWEFLDDGKVFTLALTEEDWYFTLREREKTNKK